MAQWNDLQMRKIDTHFHSLHPLSSYIIRAGTYHMVRDRFSDSPSFSIACDMVVRLIASRQKMSNQL
jgi:hypothetical protein